MAGVEWGVRVLHGGGELFILGITGGVSIFLLGRGWGIWVYPAYRLGWLRVAAREVFLAYQRVARSVPEDYFGCAGRHPIAHPC